MLKGDDGVEGELWKKFSMDGALISEVSCKNNDV